MAVEKSIIIDRFREIEPDDYFQIIHYYQRYSLDILLLEPFEFHYVQYRYMQALFETGAYEAALNEIDELIEYIFIENVEYERVKTFETLLYYKARSLYNLLQYEKAQGIAQELLSIEPHNKRYAVLLQTIVKEKMNDRDSGVRLLAIILIFSAVIISACYWLMTMNNDPKPEGYISLVILTSPCILALSVLGLSYARAELSAYFLAQKIIKAKQNKKAA